MNHVHCDGSAHRTANPFPSRTPMRYPWRAEMRAPGKRCNARCESSTLTSRQGATLALWKRIVETIARSNLMQHLGKSSAKIGWINHVSTSFLQRFYRWFPVCREEQPLKLCDWELLLRLKCNLIPKKFSTTAVSLCAGGPKSSVTATTARLRRLWLSILRNWSAAAPQRVLPK